eukprot:CAMPEP_0197479940 /NCGR_PEP_ID=MMETSP1309-20131121/37444_1 /TAXON_ID=464262 /ORGANISM="Genus nov. species nov., Strain RCC998" /LENGTH=35 /DNA_ID= /DNA_START= /DNA_END= /DNA_ORIENTATION=
MSLPSEFMIWSDTVSPAYASSISSLDFEANSPISS